MFDFRGMARMARLTMLSAGLCMVSFGVGAHHSFPATYVEGGKTTIEGELASFMFRNPHSYIHVNVKDASGNVIRYAVEWGGAATLGRQGIERSTLKPGDHVIINGLPARNVDENRVLLKTIERPSDGFRWGFEGETFN